MIDLPKLIESELQAAVEEERNRFDKECPTVDHVHFKCHVIEKSNNDIKNEALEKAAQVTHKHFLHDNCAEDCADNIEKEIRALKQGSGDGGNSHAEDCINDHASVSRLKEWAESSPRKPALTAFTEGPERQMAYLIETAAKRNADFDKP